VNTGSAAITLTATTLLLAVPSPRPADLSAQEPAAAVHGFVVDSLTGRGIADALVLLDDRREAWTDADGRYQLEAVEPGEYLLAAVTRDCRIAAARLHIVAAEPVWVALHVGRLGLGDDESRIAARAEGGGVKVVTREEILAMEARSIADVLRRAAPGMVGPPSGQAGQRTVLRERGVTTIVGSRTPLVTVDGVRVEPSALDGIHPSSVARIEIAPGATGGWAHGTEGASGVIRVYTVRDARDGPYCGLPVRRR
jgi:hypothetical protein